MKKKRKKLHFKSEEHGVQVHTEGTYIHPHTLHGDDVRMAMDAALPSSYRDMYGTVCGMGGSMSAFLGYPFLQHLSQNSLISSGVETLAGEMTREFVSITYAGHGDTEAQEAVIQELQTDFVNYEVQRVFREAAKKIGYYGGCLVFIDMGNNSDLELLKAPLILDPATFPKEAFKRFTVIDPLNIYPGLYNSSDPTRHDYFQPETWMILGKEIHKSRFLYFVGKEAPLLYKPAYNFFGVPIAQLAYEYVRKFTKNRESASELLDKFSVSVFKTNFSDVFDGRAQGTGIIDKRLDYYIKKKNNDGVFVIDKETEDFVKNDTSCIGLGFFRHSIFV